MRSKLELRKDLFGRRRPNQCRNLIWSLNVPDEFFAIVQAGKNDASAMLQLDKIWRRAEKSTRHQIRSRLADYRDELLNNAIYNAWIQHKNAGLQTRHVNLLCTNHFSIKLEFRPLVYYLKHLEIAAKWAEDEFGQLRNFPGYGFRELEIFANAEEFYIGYLGSVPAALFRLKDMILCDGTKAKYLSYVIIDENYRGFGLGKQILAEVKSLTEKSGASVIIFTTINPKVDHFYTRNEAKLIHENMDYIPHLGKNNSHPCEYFRIELKNFEPKPKQIKAI